MSIERSTSTPEGNGRKPKEYGGGASNVTACRESSRTKAQERLMEMVISRSNMMAAYGRVVSSKGAPGGEPVFCLRCIG